MVTPIRDAGAHFYRADFQVHTPRDSQWKGERPATEADRTAYAASFIAFCREKSLDAVAITDHHDFTYYPYIKAAAESEVDINGDPVSEKDRIVVYPGLELTLGVPCQAILILDADTPLDRLTSVLEALAIEPIDPTLLALPPVTRLDHIQTLEGLYEALNTRAWLKNRYIVLPNVTDGGLGTLMRSGMQVKYKNMPCVGGYLDGTVAQKAKAGSGNRQKFDGLDTAWGNKRIALFQTSDSRSRDFANLGLNSTWIKWATPSAEALRQACLAQESRISHTPPQLPSIYITSVHVSNSGFLGPIDLYLNPQYNAIIGGRGTGKSTILDYVRWCLADTPVFADADNELPTSARQRRLIQDTLASLNASVEVYVIVNGIPHTVRRQASTGELMLKVGDAEFTKASESSIQSLLPIHAYSQKQLSSVSVRLDELTRFVTAPIRQDLDAKDAQIVEASDRLRQNYASLQRARGLIRSIDRDSFAERSLLDQAVHIRSSLTGLSGSDQSVLDQRPAVDRSREAHTAWMHEVSVAQQETESLISRLRAILAQTVTVPEGVPNDLSGLLEIMRDAVVGSIESLTSSIDQGLNAFREALASPGGSTATSASLAASINDLDLRYEEVKGRSATHSEQLRELTQIEGRRTELTQSLARQRGELAEIGDPGSRHQTLRAELLRLSEERSRLLTRECDRVTDLSDGLLQTRVVRGKSFGDVERRFRALSAGSSIRSARIEWLFGALLQETDPLKTWEDVLSELEALLLVEDGVEITSEITPTLTRLGFSVADQKRLRSRMTVDSWLDLSLTPIMDTPSFRYQTREGEFIPFESASAGQQATALLKVLLSQSGMPLIIDQPEEDLDSQVIQEVVTWMWNAKKGRQVIFASHNANLVVNGDAELVVVCDYRRAGDQSGGRLKLQGAIDVPELRSEITHVMEGGEKAFKLRKDKYGF